MYVCMYNVCTLCIDDYQLPNQGGVTSMPPVVPFAFTIKMKSRCQDGLARAIK